MELFAADEEIGRYISEAMDKVGNDGVITIEESNGFNTELEVVEECNLIAVINHIW